VATASEALVDVILAYAESHGQEGEPDHEAGDLQEALRIAWRVMDDDDQRYATFRKFHEEVVYDD
jgi:hypothetical protein